MNKNRYIVEIKGKTLPLKSSKALNSSCITEYIIVSISKLIETSSFEKVANDFLNVTVFDKKKNKIIFSSAIDLNDYLI